MQSAPGRRKVLIIDVNKSRFVELNRRLEEADIAVSQVTSRSEVINRVMATKPDIVLMNLFFDGGTTLQFVREIRVALEQTGVKIIIITAHYSKDNIKECIRNGAADFILEPFETSMVLQRIKYQLQDRESYSPEDLRAEPTQIMAGFQLVYDCLRILSEVKDIHTAVHECLKKVASLSQATRVNVVLADLENAQAQVVASSDDPKLNQLNVELEKYPEVREVMLKGSIIYIKDITQNPLTRDIKANVKSIDITSMLVFPIRHRQETIGTLTVRLGKDGMQVSDKHLKTFYMVALSLSPKMAAKKLLKKIST